MIVGPFVYFFDNYTTKAYLKIVEYLVLWIGAVWAGIIVVLVTVSGIIYTPLGAEVLI